LRGTATFFKADISMLTNGGEVKNIIKTEVLDNVTTTIASPKGVTTTWLQKVFYEDGSSEIVVREQATFGYASHKGVYLLVNGGRRH
jgi:hypothetical protein